MIFDFSTLKKKSILLLSHDHADLDAVCSMSIFQRILEKQKIKSIIGVPSHFNEQALHFVVKEKISFQKNPELNAFDAIFLFDCNDFDQLGPLGDKIQKVKAKTIIKAFDHHVIEARSIDSSKEFVKPAFATTEVLFSLFEKEFDAKCYFYAALGMLEDTGHFIVGNKALFENFSKCLDKSGKDYVDLLAFTKNSIPRDERIAFLKAAERAEIHEMGKTIVLTSTLSFYQSQAASKLLDFGADIALVCGSEEKTNVSVLSVRIDSIFKEKNKFNAVRDLLKPLQERIGGDIGGHSGAAQWKGNFDHLQVLEECLFILKQKLI